MPNICTNKVVVTGPADAVARFVEAAVGPVAADYLGTHSTELRIMEEVEAGRSVEEAFRSANLRLDALNHRLTTLPLDYELSDEPLLAVPDDYEEWKKETLDSKRAHELMDEREGSVKGKVSHLSFESLVPMPDAVKQESWRLAPYSFSLSEWGPKFFFGPIGAPEVSSVTTFGTEAAGYAAAVYPLFDTPNSPVFPGLLNASKGHPDLLFLSGFVDIDCDEFRYFACKAGETLAQGAVDTADELPESCFLNDEDTDEEDERYVSVSAVLNYLTETAAIEASENDAAPKP